MPAPCRTLWKCDGRGIIARSKMSNALIKPERTQHNGIGIPLPPFLSLSSILGQIRGHYGVLTNACSIFQSYSIIRGAQGRDSRVGT